MRVFITGIGSGIGEALARELLERGAKVWAAGRKKTPPLRHENLRYLSLDLAALEKIGPALGPFLKEAGPLDLAVLNAGVLGRIDDMRALALHEIDAVMRVNVWANKVILDTMIEHGVEVAQVVGISSGAAVNANRGWGAYSLSKGALNTLLKLYSREMATTHITALAPGVVDTPMVRIITEEVDRERFPSAKRLAEGPIQTPESAAKRLLEAFEKVKKYESGSFLDVRTMDWS